MCGMGSIRDVVVRDYVIVCCREWCGGTRNSRVILRGGRWFRVFVTRITCVECVYWEVNELFITSQQTLQMGKCVELSWDFYVYALLLVFG